MQQSNSSSKELLLRPCKSVHSVHSSGETTFQHWSGGPAADWRILMRTVLFGFNCVVENVSLWHCIVNTHTQTSTHDHSYIRSILLVSYCDVSHRLTFRMRWNPFDINKILSKQDVKSSQPKSFISRFALHSPPCFHTESVLVSWWRLWVCWRDCVDFSFSLKQTFASAFVPGGCLFPRA